MVARREDCFCYLRNIQDKLADGKSQYQSPLILFALIFLQSSLYDRQKSSSSILCKDACRKIYQIRSEFWRSLDRRLAAHGLARHRELRRVRTSRQKIHVQRNRNQELAGCINISLRRWFFEPVRSRTASNLTPPKSRELPRRRTTLTLGEARSDLFAACRAQGVTLCKEKAELQTFLKLIATLLKQWKISGVCLENLVITTTSWSESIFFVPNHHSKFLSNTLPS